MDVGYKNEVAFGWRKYGVWYVKSGIRGDILVGVLEISVGSFSGRWMYEVTFGGVGDVAFGMGCWKSVAALEWGANRRTG